MGSSGKNLVTVVNKISQTILGKLLNNTFLGKGFNREFSSNNFWLLPTYNCKTYEYPLFSKEYEKGTNKYDASCTLVPSLECHTEKEDDAIFAASASWNGTIISSSQAKRALLFWFFKWWWNSSHRRPSKKKLPPAFFLQRRARHILCGTDDGRFYNSRYEWLGKYARNFECCHYKWQQRSHPALFQILATSWFFKVMMYVRGGPPICKHFQELL